MPTKPPNRKPPWEVPDSKGTAVFFVLFRLARYSFAVGFLVYSLVPYPETGAEGVEFIRMMLLFSYSITIPADLVFSQADARERDGN
ncbi:hypothetical protein A3A40_00065 [Candidatus Kaiserbacteria bacterium RIFCSPLOWO2_01_FULL_54_20]|uniref:Uncharacterized protein n=1 Tax=Candidatus Kaiserbacteria bacterium RIFCSPLOWO2_01_FULL_54_20 TaxID=1798513 RepID=A0A1F6EIS1_9BACT|nr:MAG: hypothetical protein A3A40_00065 [Candidatus Kaiserbacteria bacterium RIFCSPLOWO2_01_FULL_54_20]